MTVRPPADAGFGENDCVPFCRMMVMVTAPADGEDGETGDEGAPPPHETAQTTPAAAAAARTRRRRIRFSISPADDERSARAIPELDAVFARFGWGRVTARVSPLRLPAHNHQPPTTNNPSS